jgi:hypothetical protein
MSSSTAVAEKKSITKVPVKNKTKKDIAAGYNEIKHFNGAQYTGMQIGRSLKWHYDQGEWTETKISPDLWEISYAVTKRRVGHAPEGSGVPVGTGYSWYIMAHQVVKKLNANDYTTALTGLKYKLAHKRAEKENWSATAPAQRKHLVEFLKQMIPQLESEPVPLAFDYKGKKWKGEAVPVPGACADKVCYELDVTLNGEPVGIIHRGKSGWKIKHIADQKFVDAIGEQVMLWYE